MQQPVDPLLQDPRAPECLLRRAGHSHGGARRDPVSAWQHDPGTPDVVVAYCSQLRCSRAGVGRRRSA
jgi:hypothetical protein